MIRLNRILCPLDFSKCSKVAFENAISLARTTKAELHLFHAILMYEHDSYRPDDRLPDNLMSYELIEDISKGKLSELVDQHQDDSLKILTASARGFSAAEEILTYAREHQIDLIMMGTHGRTALGHLLLGSVAERVIRLSKCPVMTFRKDAKKIGTFQRIFVPIDFSDYSKLALQYGLELAHLFGFGITVFHSIEQQIHPAFYAAGKTSIFEIDSDLKNRGIAAMKQFREQCGYNEVPTEYALAEGAAYQQIVDYSKRANCDLLVIASLGLRGLEQFLIGSTTEKVIRHAEVPVLTVKLQE